MTNGTIHVVRVATFTIRSTVNVTEFEFVHRNGLDFRTLSLVRFVTDKTLRAEGSILFRYRDGQGILIKLTR